MTSALLADSELKDDPSLSKKSLKKLKQPTKPSVDVPVRGRPPTPINWDMFEQLCSLQCTQSEVASFFRMGAAALCERVKKQYLEEYMEVYKRFSESGKCSLRRNQFVLSKTNAAMAIWLGKQWLGQRETNLELTLPAEHQAKYDALMRQLGQLQAKAQSQLEERKIEDKSINAEQKSA